MSAFDLRNIAIAMGKVILQLNELEKKGTGWSALDDNKEEYLVAAYMCRVGILDVIERNTSSSNYTIRYIQNKKDNIGRCS
jgi:hypothetical protein